MHIPNDEREITNEIDEFKLLIEAARADMVSHPAFPQECIKYEAFAAESEKGNIYHAVLELNQNEGDELIAQMKENDDTQIIRYVSLFWDVYCWFGGHDFRKRLIELNPDNNGAMMLLTSDNGYVKRTLTETMAKKYSVKDQLDIFEFHDARLELLRYEKTTGDLVLSAKYLNIHKDTKQNPSEHHMEIKDALIHFTNFRNLTIDTDGIYRKEENGDLIPIEEPVNMSGDAALKFLLEKLSSNCFFEVFELTKEEDGTYYMPVSTMTQGFNARFSFDSVIIAWDEYNGWAWYESAQWIKPTDTENKQ